MDFIIFLAWILFIIWQVNASRKKRRKIKTEKRQPREVIWKQQKIPEKSEKRNTGYDFKGFRKTLRKSWGLDTGNGNMEKQKTEKGRMVVFTSDEGESTSSNDRMEYENFKTPVVEKPVPYSKPVDAEAPQVPQAVVASKKQVRRPKSRWNHEDVKKWMVYDAVLGKPRCKNPWRPYPE